MPFYERGDVRIHYEEAGSGFPLLIIPGGGLNAMIPYVTVNGPFNVFDEFKSDFRVIAADLRNANGSESSGPLEIDRPWDAYTDDHLGLMDHLGIKQFMVMGFCIGGPFIWNMLKRASERVVASMLAVIDTHGPGTTTRELAAALQREETQRGLVFEYGLVACGAILFFNVVPAVAVLIGGAVAMSSTAIIIAQLTEQSENNRTHGRLAVAICLFQDLSFPLLLALLSALSGGVGSVDAAHILGAIGLSALALLLVLAAGRWLLRPLFLMIASVRSAELFSLAVLLAVLASAWATQAVGLSLALGAFLAGMMLAETEFRHQVEATIRSYREVLLGLFFITVGMLLDVRLLLRDLPVVMAILVGMLLLKAAVVAVVAKPATKSWFKSLRTGVIVAQGGEFGFALLILLLRKELLDPAIVQPLLAATVLSMVFSPLIR